MLNVELVVESISRLALPCVILIIFLSLRNEIKMLINRINAIKWPGVVELRAEQQKPSEEIPSIGDNLKKDKVAKLERVDTSKNDLINQLASLQVALHFERTYNLIFGSQIRLLEGLERLGSSGENYENMAATYQNEQATYAISHSYPLRNYLGFLENAGLVKIISNANRRKVSITPMGVDFLEYIRTMRYPVKPWS